MDTADKSVIREDQILICFSKSEDIKDKWTQRTNASIVNFRIHFSVSKTVDIVDNWTQ